MTDLLEPYVDTSVDDLPPLETTDDRTTDNSVPAPFLAYLLAACLTGAGIIHLAMVPSHMGEWRPEGWAFLGSAVLQLGLAVGLVLRPRRWMAGVAIVSSLVLIFSWWFTRYAGMPFGPSEHYLEDPGTVDVTTVVLEAAAIVVATVTLVRPRLSAGWKAPVLVFASLIPLAAIIAGTLAVASPEAAAHGGHADGAAHGKDDLGLWKLTNGHHHAMTNNALDPKTQAELKSQLAITREVAEQYPTVAAAEAAGYRRAGPVLPRSRGALHDHRWSRPELRRRDDRGGPPLAAVDHLRRHRAGLPGRRLHVLRHDGDRARGLRRGQRRLALPREDLYHDGRRQINAPFGADLPVDRGPVPGGRGLHARLDPVHGPRLVGAGLQRRRRRRLRRGEPGVRLCRRHVLPARPHRVGPEPHERLLVEGPRRAPLPGSEHESWRTGSAGADRPARSAAADVGRPQPSAGRGRPRMPAASSQVATGRPARSQRATASPTSSALVGGRSPP